MTKNKQAIVSDSEVKIQMSFLFIIYDPNLDFMYKWFHTQNDDSSRHGKTLIKKQAKFIGKAANQT